MSFWPTFAATGCLGRACKTSVTWMHKCTNHLVDFLKQMTFCEAACSQPSQQISIYLQGITEQRFLAVLGWLHHVKSIIHIYIYIYW